MVRRAAPAEQHAPVLRAREVVDGQRLRVDDGPVRPVDLGQLRVGERLGQHDERIDRQHRAPVSRQARQVRLPREHHDARADGAAIRLRAPGLASGAHVGDRGALDDRRALALDRARQPAHQPTGVHRRGRREPDAPDDAGNVEPLRPAAVEPVRTREHRGGRSCVAPRRARAADACRSPARARRPSDSARRCLRRRRPDRSRRRWRPSRRAPRARRPGRSDASADRVRHREAPTCTTRRCDPTRRTPRCRARR